MKVNKGVALAAAAFFSLFASSQPASASEATRCFPENNFNLLDDPSAPSNVDEKAFHEISNRAVNYFKTYAELHGAELTVNNDWADSTVNAYAEQDETGKKWSIQMFGGLARRKEVTPDGFALVVCHELGHHFGGFAFYSGDPWAAAEGQADYFATQACARAVWVDDLEENAKHRATVAPAAKEACDRVWSTEKEQNLCYRTSQGGMSLATLLSALGGQKEPKFETPDPKKVAKTVTSHPKGQCRLDTYFSGALCKATADLRVIPGRNHADGQGSVGAEQESALYTCSESKGFTEGLRPRCWFKSQL